MYRQPYFACLGVCMYGCWFSVNICCYNILFKSEFEFVEIYVFFDVFCDFTCFGFLGVV